MITQNHYAPGGAVLATIIHPHSIVNSEAIVVQRRAATENERLGRGGYR